MMFMANRIRGPTKYRRLQIDISFRLCLAHVGGRQSFLKTIANPGKQGNL